MNEQHGYEYSVGCLLHGELGTVAQAHLGLALFTAHEKAKGCELKITPKLKPEYVHKRPIEARKAIPPIA